MQDKDNQLEPAAAEESAAIDAAPPAADELADKLAKAEAKAAEMEDAFMRAKAEVENGRRRAQDDVARARKFAIESFAEALLPVRDNLETALKIDTPSVESLKAGRRNDAEAVEHGI